MARMYFGEALDAGAAVPGHNTWESATAGMTGYTGVLPWGHNVRQGLSGTALTNTRDNATAPRLNMVGFSFFPADYVRQAGGAPVTWNNATAQSDLNVNDSAYRIVDSGGKTWNLAAIANGDHDVMFGAEFDVLATFDTPLFYNAFREHNAFWGGYGTWQVWFQNGYWINGNTPTNFINAWKHLQVLAASRGANKLSWLWCPNVVLSTAGQRPPDETFPGADCVDYVTVDGYVNATHLTFDSIFQGTYQLMKTGAGAGYSGKNVLLPDSGPGTNVNGGPPWFAIKETGADLAANGAAAYRAYIADADATLNGGAYAEFGLYLWFFSSPNDIDTDATSLVNFRTMANRSLYVKSTDTLVAAPQTINRVTSTGTRTVIAPPWYVPPVITRHWTPQALRSGAGRVWTPQGKTW